MTSQWKGRVLVALFVAIAAVFLGGTGVGAQLSGSADLPAGFELSDTGLIENIGQWDAQGAYRLGIEGATVWVTPNGLMHHVVDPAYFVTEDSPEAEGKTDEPVAQHGVYATYVGSLSAELVPHGQLPGEYNFLVGAEEKHRTGVRSFGTVELRSLYPGISAFVTPVEKAEATDESAATGFKVSYQVAGGANVDDLVIDYVGADAVALGENGNLYVTNSFGDFVEMRPTAYQVIGGQQEPVLVWFEVDGTEVSFSLGANYDDSHALFLDPIVLYSAPFIGGSSSDYAAEMQKDDSGWYFTGNSYSANWPTTSGAYSGSIRGSTDWTATKMSPDMQTLYWTTFIGGDYYDYGGNSALASDGSLYIAGSTYYPLTYAWPYVYRYHNSTSTSTGYDCAVFHLSANGSSRVSSMVYGSTSSDYCGDVELDAKGDVIVTGSGYSTTTFLTVPGYDTTYAGGYDPFVARFSADLSTYMDFTYVGGSTSSDGTYGAAFDSAGNIYVYGIHYYTNTDYTTKIGPGGGSYDMFVAKFDAGLDSRYYLAMIGGDQYEPGYWGYTSYTYYASNNSGIYVDDSNRAWVTGYTRSSNFPTTAGAYQPTFGSSSSSYPDAFVLSLNSGGTALDAATYLGGTLYDYGKAIGLDSDGRVYVGGTTSSANFPTTPGEVGETQFGGYDWFRTILEPDLSDVICSTYWGSTSTDYGIDLIVDEVDYRAQMFGIGYSTFPNQPGMNNTFGGGGGYDYAFLDLTCGGASLEVQNAEYKSIPKTHSFDCLTAGDVVQFTFDILNTSALGDQLDNEGPEFEATARGPMALQSCVATSGDCMVNGASVAWNGEIPSGGIVSFDIRGRVLGGIPAGTEICLVGTVNSDIGLGYNSNSEEFELCAMTDCPPTVDPNQQLGMQVHLPILNFLGMDDCDVWIEVQNVGAESIKATLVTWGEAGFCPPQAAGPLKVECTGLLRPGTTWNLMGDQIPDGSKSGMLFKWSTKLLSDFGLDAVFGFDDIFADLMCETLFFGVVGDSDDFRRFKKAYNEGGTFAGIPLDIAAGFDEGGILAVDVLRTCDADTTPGAKVTSKYNGIAGSHLGAYDPVYGGYTYYVPLIYAERGGFNTWVYIQNGGLECSSVEIWMKAQDDCLRAQICEVSALAPGETFQFDPNTCVGNGWLGSAWIRTSQPMGIAVDIYGSDVLMTYVGEPAELNFTFDPEQAEFTGGNQVAIGPLVYSEYQGWDSGVQVQNLSPVVNAKVKVYFVDRSGDVITTLVDWICPRGAQTFFLPVVHDLPGNWAGSIRVESQEYLVPGGPAVRAPNIVAVATLVKYSDSQRTETREAIAYNLLPEHKIFDWQIGFGGGGLDSGVGLIAIPSLLADLDGTGVTTEVAITNVVPKPGFTDFVIWIYDQNGLLDYVCQKLNEKQVEYIDLNTWGFINNGFKGSAVISAVFWEHDVFDDDGFFLRNLVGLGAVSLERSGAILGDDQPGDEAAGSRGIPFARSDVEDEEFDFTFLGVDPACPGVPLPKPKPGEEARWQCPPTDLNGTFGAGGSWSDYDTWSATSRIFRDGVPSECQPQKTCPTILTGGGYVDAYYFDNPEGKETCVEVNVTHSCGVQCMAYAVYGEMPNGIGWGGCPVAPGVDYIGDVGQSGTPGRMGFTIPAGESRWTLLFANVGTPTVCDYTVTISGFDCQ